MEVIADRSTVRLQPLFILHVCIHRISMAVCFFVLLLLAAESSLAAGATSKATSSSAALITESKIIGGDPLDIEDAAFVVQVFETRRPGYKVCGGSIINKFHVLTAGHCVVDNAHNPGAITVTVGLTRLSRYDTVHSRRVTKVHMHPKYKQNKGEDSDYVVDYDVAVLLVDKVIPYESVTIAPQSAGDIPEGKKLRLAGWGLTSTNSGSSPTLRTSTFTVISRYDCIQRLKYNQLTPREFCIDESTTHAYCHGDSGSPLYDDSTDTQYGLASWGQCGDNKVGVAADLTVPEIHSFVAGFA